MTGTAVAPRTAVEMTVGDRRDLAASSIQQTGVNALATMSDEEFAYRLETMVKGRERVQQIQRAMMRDGVHFGKMPGQAPDAKPGLFKPGAEVLCQLYSLVPDCPLEKVQIAYGDPANETSPAIRVLMRCEVHQGADGPIVGIGYGASSSWEIKYRYRNAARLCPGCNKPTIIKSKYEAKGGPFVGQKPWWCNSKAGGCGNEYAPVDPAITEQQVGRVANPDAMDLLNTLVKMAEKRAKVDATIAATGTSDLFTQDVEDLAPEEASEAAAAKAAAKPAAASNGEPKAKAPAAHATGPTVPFGPHKDKPLGVLDTDELVGARDWAVRNDPNRWNPFITAADDELERRREAGS